MLSQAGDRAGAEAQLRAALAEKEILRNDFTPEFEANLTAFLAAILYEEGRTDEAAKTAKPVCGAVATRYFADLLAQRRLCP